ncbi:hypothetical protein [Bacillus velezensis]|uniref:hypothetical protein n=1 Tax=Bacillus velezensis TaxID=492670 RepID=UPI00223EF521|nr:hypothetical protein [Bacillus velezensis]
MSALFHEKAVFLIKKSISIRGWIQYEPVPFCFIDFSYPQSDKRFSVKSFNNY